MALKILVIEDHVLVLEGMLHALTRLGPVEAGGARDGEEALAALERQPDMDLVLLDLLLPGINGFSLLSILRRRFPAVAVIIVSALEDRESVQRAIQQGANGFVPKSSSTDTLLEAIRQVLEGNIWLPEQYAGETARRRKPEPIERLGLTAAQRRVFELLAQGKSNREIAELLGLTEGTVKLHVTRILRALNVSNRSQALLYAARCGLKL